MKKLTVYLLSIAVCLSMLAGMVSAASAVAAEPKAESKTDGTVSDLLQLTDDTAADTAINVNGQTQWNTLLGDVPEDTGEKQNRWVAAKAGKGYVFYDNTAIEDVLAYIRTQLKDRKTTFAVTYQTQNTYDYKAFANLMFAGALEHTGVGNEGDYLRWIWRKENCDIAGYEKRYITYTYQLTYLTTAAQEAKVDTAVEKLIKTLDLKNCTDYQKVRKIYDWICDNVTYDQAGLKQGVENSPLTWTAYKALFHGTCVCQGYASLFYRMALECGIDTRIIAGNPQAPHAWNIVKLGGYYYNLDATWDSEFAQVNQPYRYFLRSPANFNSNHTRYDEYNTAEFHYYYPMSSKDYVPGAPVAGDMDGNEDLTTDDAVYLLLNIMFGSGDYAIASSARRDTNGDGTVTTDDAVYLLLHIMFGTSDYPLTA